MLMNVNSDGLKGTPVHLSIECKIVEPRVSGKPAVNHGLLAVGHQSSSTQRVTSLVPSLHSFQVATGTADFVAPRPNAVTIGNYFKHLMYDVLLGVADEVVAHL